jgi:hypothetical protein
VAAEHALIDAALFHREKGWAHVFQVDDHFRASRTCIRGSWSPAIRPLDRVVTCAVPIVRLHVAEGGADAARALTVWTGWGRPGKITAVFAPASLVGRMRPAPPAPTMRQSCFCNVSVSCCFPATAGALIRNDHLPGVEHDASTQRKDV